MIDLGLAIDGTFAWLWSNSLAIIGWIIAVIAFVVVPFRRPPAEARNWLLIFFALPWVALLIYWLIGRPRYAKLRRKRVRDLPGILDRIVRCAGLDDAEKSPVLCEDNLSLANLARGLGQFPAIDGNRIDTLGDYYGTIDRIIAEIDSARHHVNVEFYILKNDRVGERLLTALERASARGVTCRLLIDALGSYGSVASIKRRLESAGVEVQDILPLRRRLSSSRVDLRNHRKIVVVDGQIGYTGSQNMWAPEDHGRRANRELAVRVTGPLVAQLQAIFVCDWYLETLEELVEDDMFPARARDEGVAAQMIATGPDNPAGGLDLIVTQAMHNASEEIVIVTPYFVPNDSLLTAIRGAVLRGVRVSLITAAKSDHFLAGLAQRSYYEELLAMGAQIHLFGPEFLHAKHFRVDHEVSILGSSNMDVRSFELNAEIDLLCYDSVFAEALQKVENGYLEQSRSLSFAEWKGRALRHKVLENTARMMSELI
ncbi:cardiolipin synthase [Alteriqipengyuania lutimaris]|uniref:Cardiolipin synthase n=1 Tax=Alteriqipengyuania lutimaris TaxID=1538146 RepID=A0A395LNT9_9SPHN|nr:cardiolipin synthase [Alteriqipengyuania lutimaris]MBB3033857.1 cardiolipin synthase [Alteriqipengyuania lutimaris]RDS77174.1 cardiolipin synthase [Alteriqipengyuania lutimaris]